MNKSHFSYTESVCSEELKHLYFFLLRCPDICGSSHLLLNLTFPPFPSSWKSGWVAAPDVSSPIAQLFDLRDIQLQRALVSEGDQRLCDNVLIIISGLLTKRSRSTPYYIVRSQKSSYDLWLRALNRQMSSYTLEAPRSSGLMTGCLKERTWPFLFKLWFQLDSLLAFELLIVLFNKNMLSQSILHYFNYVSM